VTTALVVDIRLAGHSSIAATGDAYGHTRDSTARAAVEGLADQLGILDL
jgi:hypothetical protein